MVCKIQEEGEDIQWEKQMDKTKVYKHLEVKF